MQARGAVVIRDAMPEQHRAFFTDQRFVILGALDDTGHPQPFLRAGSQGFMTSPAPTELVIASNPQPFEPEHLCLGSGDKISVLGIEFETRRRNRMNGTVIENNNGRMRIAVDQSFGNCPRYIHVGDDVRFAEARAEVTEGTVLTAHDIAHITAADMFFIASRAPQMGADPRAGVDVNHRGGRPGFLKILNEQTLIFPDYNGNNFFNTIGNIMLDARVALLLPDFKNGDALSFAGRAEIMMDADANAANYGATRMVKVILDHIRRASAALPLRYTLQNLSNDPPEPGKTTDPKGLV